MTRVIHTGDTHLGYQQYHSPTRRQDFLDAFERVVDDAVSDDVDAVVHAGDLFHDRRPALPDLLGTLSALRRLADAGVPFLAVVGNHESTRGGQWLDLFERLGLATRLGSSPVVVGDVAFYGLDHVPVSKRADLDYAFEPHDAASAALVAHGLFTPFAHADWETETVLEEATVDFDVVLLGDNHEPGTERVDGTPVTYCGSTERVSAAERDGRGYNLVTFDGNVDIRRRAVETRPFQFVPVDLAEGEGEERVREQVRQHQLDGAVVVVEITGDGDPVTPAAVEQLALDEGALVARVTDRREFERAGDTGSVVEFADPDAAVRERVTELGLSPAALDVDDAVRGDVADANVRETVKRRVEERLDDVSGFEPADTDGTAIGDETTPRADGDRETVSADAEREAEANTNVESDRDTDTDAEAERAPAGDGSADEVGGGDATASDGDTTAVDGEQVDDDAAGTTETTDGPTDETEPDTSRSGTGGDDGGDGQVSMEDFL
jgi:DNA repair exonuclease SbcCD nuclease subunit